jgi:hypothetical protein
VTRDDDDDNSNNNNNEGMRGYERLGVVTKESKTDRRK